ncbi:MAG: HAD hydrolase-like protein, partial [Gemmatimonadetes bacterium]|nr:HAD hydrolase-like protein [Gemmatimonadota bacterium]
MNLIFDLDGTLLDSQSGILGSLRHTVQALGIDGLDDTALAAWIGPSIYESFASALGTDDAERVHAAVTAYRDHYAEVGIHGCRPFDGVHDLLR